MGMVCYFFLLFVRLRFWTDAMRNLERELASSSQVVDAFPRPLQYRKTRWMSSYLGFGVVVSLVAVYWLVS